MKKYYIAMAILAAIGLTAVVWDYVITRGAAKDEVKVRDITDIQSAVSFYASSKGQAPASLHDISLDSKVVKRLSAYEYTHTETSYTICANFMTDVSKDTSYYSADSPYSHKKGHQCFTSELNTYYPYSSPTTPSYDPTSQDYLNNYNQLYQ